MPEIENEQDLMGKPVKVKLTSLFIKKETGESFNVYTTGVYKGSFVIGNRYFINILEKTKKIRMIPLDTILDIVVVVI